MASKNLSPKQVAIMNLIARRMSDDRIMDLLGVPKSYIGWMKYRANFVRYTAKAHRTEDTTEVKLSAQKEQRYQKMLSLVKQYVSDTGMLTKSMAEMLRITYHTMRDFIKIALKRGDMEIADYKEILGGKTAYRYRPTITSVNKTRQTSTELD